MNLFQDNVSNLDIFGYLGGHGKIFCEEHGIPLSVDFTKSGYHCCLKSNVGTGFCSNKSSYRRLQPKCSACICRKHSSDYLSNTEISMVSIPSVDHDLNSLQNTTLSDESDSDDHECFELDNVNFVDHSFLITDSGVRDDNARITDPGIDALSAELVSTDAASCPLHVEWHLQIETK